MQRPGMLDAGLVNYNHRVCHFLANVEVFLNFAPIREALWQCGAHPVVTQFRRLMQSRPVAASVEPLIEVVCAAAPELWGHSQW